MWSYSTYISKAFEDALSDAMQPTIDEARRGSAGPNKLCGSSIIMETLLFLEGGCILVLPDYLQYVQLYVLRSQESGF
jgi:hypothetical protein